MFLHAVYLIRTLSCNRHADCGMLKNVNKYIHTYIQLGSGLVCALFCSLYQPISLSRSPRQGIRAWFSVQSGTADQVISLIFFTVTAEKNWLPLIFNGFRTLLRVCPANVMSVAMLWKARLCFLSIVVRITFEQKNEKLLMLTQR